MSTEHENLNPKEHYFYFVDGDKYESNEERTTGAIIKSKLPEAKRDCMLFEEEQGNQPDKEIFDVTPVTLAKDRPKRFCAIPKPKEKYFYFVDSVKYESDEQHTTGAIIQSKLPEAKRGYALWEEGHGNEPDKQILPTTSITLERDKPKRFYTVPPATAGVA
jgi:hypothetical protein